MKPATFASVVAMLLLQQVAADEYPQCRKDVLYCGKTLKNIGWSTRNIWIWLEGNYRKYTSENQYDELLFQCHHMPNYSQMMPHTLYYRVSCTKGCVDAGAGNNDYCR